MGGKGSGRLRVQICPRCQIRKKSVFEKSGKKGGYCKPCYRDLARTWYDSKNGGETRENFDWRGTFMASDFTNYRQSAKRRNLDFKITKQDFLEMRQKPCFYCGGEPSGRIITNKQGQKRGLWNGLDRIDNNRNYTIENLVPCCSMCNKMKSKFQVTTFLAQCRAIAKRNPIPESKEHFRPISFSEIWDTD